VHCSALFKCFLLVIGLSDSCVKTEFCKVIFVARKRKTRENSLVYALHYISLCYLLRAKRSKI